MTRTKRFVVATAVVLSLLFGLAIAAQADSTISLEDVKQLLGEVPAPTSGPYPTVAIPAFTDAAGGNVGYYEIAGLVEGQAEGYSPVTKDQVLAYAQKMTNYGFGIYDTTSAAMATQTGLSLTFTKGNAKVVLVYNQEISNVLLVYQQGIEYVKEGGATVQGGTLVVQESYLTLRVNGVEKTFTLRDATRTMYGEYGSISAVFEYRDGTGAVQDQFALAFPASATLGSAFSMADSANVALSYTGGGVSDKVYFATKVVQMDLAANAVKYVPQPSEGASYQLTITGVSADASAFQGTLQGNLLTQNGEWVEIGSGSFVIAVK
ncbi:MAG TPA: hypothetical protein PKE04_06500 [Clostridia bacterium]|nr:hypothetical protein [Clostridia bacterium]